MCNNTDIDIGDPDNEDVPDKYTDRTTANSWGECKKAMGSGYSPTKQMQVAVKVYKGLPSKHKKGFHKRINPDAKDQLNGDTVEICAKIYKANKIKKGKIKSNDNYEQLEAMSPLLKDETVSTIRENLKISNKKANEVKCGVIQRQMRKPKFTPKEIQSVQEFYDRSDVSRVNPSRKSKKLGVNISYMRLTIGKARKKFLKEYPNIKMSYSKFHSLKPKHIKPISKTPLNACSCVYCTNINEKFKVLNIPGLKNEQDLYKQLICKKTKRFRNHKCIFAECENCKDRKAKIELLAITLDMRINVSWKTWEYIDYQQKSGKVVSKKILVTKNGSVRKCLDELIYTDVMKPGKSFTFVQHFFTQSFQFQMYLDNIHALKPGQCLGVQDFARNLEVSFRVEIKAANWSKQQMTVHPQVFYFKTSETEETQRLVVIHLSDIAKHDAQLVHHMTQDCINILSENYPNEKWEKFYLWSDGCASQYKGKSSFYYLDKFEVEVERNFFGSEHGKNECDAMTGQISMQYQNAVKADDIIIMNAADLKNYLEKLDIYETDNSKIFKLVTAHDKDLNVINQEFNNVKIQVLDGTCTRKLHQIKADRNKGCLLTRPFSCFCQNCLTNDFKHCENKSFTGGNFTERQLNSGRKDDIKRKKKSEWKKE